jgi:hypothetical protein
MNIPTMNLVLPLSAIAFATCLSPLWAEQTGRMPTHEQIVELERKAQKAPVIPAAKRTNSVAKSQPPNLLSSSEILCYNGLAAMVPKLAVIHIPKSMSSRLGMKPESAIKSWSDFLKMNLAWVRTVEVTMDQAYGKVPMKEEVVKSYEKGSQVIIATYKGHPISVLPLQNNKLSEAENVSAPSKK